MSDYEDFVNSYGYSAGDPYAMDNILSQWAADERDAELLEEYKIAKNLGKAKSKDSGEITRIGIGNFKPFSKKQEFSNKPITLLYGPNSIGKSSVLHFQMLLNYFFTKNSYDLVETDMFGDRISLGGFDKYIHKRDKDNELIIKFDIENCGKAFNKFINIEKKYLTCLDALKFFKIDTIIEIINNSEKYIFGIFKESKLYRKNIFGCETKSRDGNIKLNAHSKEWSEGMYVYSTYYPSYDDSHTQSIMLEDVSEIIFENDEFCNDDTMLQFVSDIFIPKYILPIKSKYCIENYPDLEENGFINLSDSDINNIAKIVYEKLILDIASLDYINYLNTNKITCSIYATIGYVNLGSDEYPLVTLTTKNVKYTFENEKESKKSVEFQITKNSNGTSKDFSQLENDFIPKSIEDYHQLIRSQESEFKNVFGPIPDHIYNAISNSLDRSDINNLFEKNEDLLSLSYKDGYKCLIGSLNDLIGFKDIQYIGPLRFYPNRNETFDNLDMKDDLVPSSLESWKLLKNDKLRSKVNAWLSNKDKLKSSYQVKYRELIDLNTIFSKFTAKNFDELVCKYLDVPFCSEDEIEQLKKLDGDDGLSINELPRERQKIIAYEDNQDKIEEIIELKNSNPALLMRKIIEKISKSVESRKELVFEDLNNGTHLSPRDLGLGISQILPVLIAAYDRSNTRILIEQPELHLHPAVQCELADEFIRSYHERGNEFMIETHSEHLLLRIMKRMRHTAEGKVEDESLRLTPDDVCLLYVDSDGGNTFIRELELDNDGTLLDPWPGGFFEEGYNERFS